MSHTNLITINSTEINNLGAFRVGDDLTSGTAGQVLKSQGPEQAPQWDNDTDTQLNLTAALPVVINNGGGLNREVALDIDTATMGVSGGELEVLKVPNALTFTGTSTGTYDGSSALSINLTDTDTQLNLTAALPVIINNGGGLNREVELDISGSTTMEISGGELEVLKVPNTLTFTGTATGTYDGSSALSINLTDTDTTYQGSSTININTATNPDTINCLKVPNVMTAGTNISMVNTDDGASATTYDGSEPITITAASSGTTYDGGTNINIDTSTTPDEINLDTSITGQTGITFLNSGASTNLTGSNYPGKPTTATNLDLTDTSNIISPYFFHDVYDPSSTTGQSLTTSYIQIFSGNLKNTFTAKATSCCIEIIVMSYTVSSNRWLYLQLADNTGTEWSVGSYSNGGGTGTGTRSTTRLVHYPDETDRQIVIQTWYLQGLTIGNTYTINPRARTSSTTNQLWTGGVWPACICRGYYLPS